MKNFTELVNRYTDNNMLRADAGLIPCILESYINNDAIDIEDTEEEFVLPAFAERHFEELLNSFGKSVIYNNLNVRVNDWGFKDGKFVLHTGRTTYFNSMVTNRRMDTVLECGLTVREVLEPGPYVHTLRTSSLSNHLGFNGFVISKDGYICFVYRKGNMSIGSKTWGTSVGASMKTKYALENGVFTKAGLFNSIRKEIEDELAISDERICKVDIIAAYRDFVEGGKPQLLFVAETSMTREEIQKAFDKKANAKISRTLSERESKEAEMLTDGDELFWVTKKDILKCQVFANQVAFGSHILPVMPSVAASVLLFRDMQ